MNKLLSTTPFSTFEKWYVEYYLNTAHITSTYRMVRIGDLITPIKRRIKKNDYDGVLPIVSKIVFKSGEIVFRKENKTGMDLLYVKKGDLLISIAILLINANSRCAEPPFAIVRTYCF